MKGEDMISEVPTDPIEIAKLRVLTNEELLGRIDEIQSLTYEDMAECTSSTFNKIYEKYYDIFRGKIGFVQMRKYVCENLEVNRGRFQTVADAQNQIYRDVTSRVAAFKEEFSNRINSPEFKQRIKLIKETRQVRIQKQIKLKGYVYDTDELF